MIRRLILTFAALSGLALAAPRIDTEAFGKSLGPGGWKGDTVSYSLSGSDYRTYKPEVSPTPDGGIFVSIRIDHLRGWLASNDHAVLEITVAPSGAIASAQSSLALQGLSISSDLIRGTASAGAGVAGVGAAVKVGTDLAADLSSKLLREKVVEAGRVTFPAVLRHNFNQLFQSVRTGDAEPAAAKPEGPKPEGEKPAEAAKPAEGAKPEEHAKPADAPKPPESAKLDIKPYGEPAKPAEAPKK